MVLNTNRRSILIYYFNMHAEYLFGNLKAYVLKHQAVVGTTTQMACTIQ